MADQKSEIRYLTAPSIDSLSFLFFAYFRAPREEIIDSQQRQSDNHSNKDDHYRYLSVREELRGNQPTKCTNKAGENKNLFEVNPLLSMNVEYYLVNMNILVDIDDRSIQKWLREVDTQDLAKALNTKDKRVALQQKIFAKYPDQTPG